jgi:hypothetical protein
LSPRSFKHGDSFLNIFICLNTCDNHGKISQKEENGVRNSCPSNGW